LKKDYSYVDFRIKSVEKLIIFLYKTLMVKSPN